MDRMQNTKHRTQNTAHPLSKQHIIFTVFFYRLLSMAVDEKWIAQIWIRQGEYTPDMRESLRNIQIQLHKNAQDKAQVT